MADHTHLDWRDLFPQIQLPVLMCVGRQSRVFPWQGSAYVNEHIAGAKRVFFEHSGHMLFYEEPEKFNLMAATAAERLGLAARVAHLDRTSFHVDGHYHSGEEPAEQVVHIAMTSGGDLGKGLSLPRSSP